MSFLQMSFAGSCIIIVTVVVRALGIHKLPKRMFLVLWGIAFVRLLFPFTIHSPFGVSALIEQSVPVMRTDMAPAVSRGTMSTGGTPHPIVLAPSTAPTASPHTGISIWMFIWLAGIGICLFLFLLSYVRWYKLFRSSVPVDNAFTREWLKTHALRRKISIRQTEGISAPLTYGIFHPVILVPVRMNWAEEEVLKYVFAHEYVHIRRFDALAKLALAAAPCVHWFNPLVWVMYVLANRDIELICDEAVIRSIGTYSKKSYAFALLELEEKRSGFALLANGFSRNAIEERIRAIMKMKKIKLPAILLAIILVIGMATAFATSAPVSADTNHGVTSDDESAREESGASADYSIYEPYGLLYDAENSYYTYGGHVVAYFYDPIGHASFTNYFTGTIELEAVYDSNNVLIGIQVCSPETYASHAEKRARFANPNGASDQDEGTTQTGSQSAEIDWLKEYAPYGISFDATKGRWCFNGREIKMLIDLDAASIYRTDEDGICLMVLRDKDGVIDTIEECSEKLAFAVLEEEQAHSKDLIDLEAAIEAKYATDDPSAGETTAAPNEFTLDEAAMTETAIQRLAANHPGMDEWIRAQYPDVVWWTVEGYSAWATYLRKTMISEFGQVVGWSSSSGDLVVDQQLIDEQAEIDLEVLRLLAEGWMISKSIGGDESQRLQINPADWGNDNEVGKPSADEGALSASEFAVDEAAMTETALQRLATYHPEMVEWVQTQYPDVTWWTVEGYSAWMMYEQRILEGMLGSTFYWDGETDETVVTQEYIDATMAIYQEDLQYLAEGWLVSKTINGNPNISLKISPADLENGRAKEFEIAFRLNNGREAHFGPYDTAAELLEELIPFTAAEVAAGNLDQSEADEVIEFYRSKID